jgi:hypothetical protein
MFPMFTIKHKKDLISAPLSALCNEKELNNPDHLEKYLISAPQSPCSKRDKDGYQNWNAGMCVGYMKWVYEKGI